MYSKLRKLPPALTCLQFYYYVWWNNLLHSETSICNLGVIIQASEIGPGIYVMKNKLIIITTMLLIMLFGIHGVFAQPTSQPKEIKLHAEFYQNELNLLLANARRGNYADFYQDLVKFARYGEKYPQYLLGLILVRGDGVQQDIAQGLVWMRLALEQRNSEWQKAYDVIISAIPQDQLLSIEPMFEEYKSRYGVDTQKMSCTQEKMRNSSIRLHQCRKVLTMKEYYLVYDFE